MPFKKFYFIENNDTYSSLSISYLTPLLTVVNSELYLAYLSELFIIITRKKQ